MTEKPQQRFDLPIQWPVDPFDVPRPVNQMSIQSGETGSDGGNGPSQFQLKFGYVSLPVFLGEVSQEQINQLTSDPIPVATVGNFVLTRARLIELRTMLDQVIRDTNGTSDL